MKNIIYLSDIYLLRLFIFHKSYLVDLPMHVPTDASNSCTVKHGYIAKGQGGGIWFVVIIIHCT